MGGIYQQASSVVTAVGMLYWIERVGLTSDERRRYIDQTAYEFDGAQYSIYAFQYKPGFGDAVSTDPLRREIVVNSYRDSTSLG